MVEPKLTTYGILHMLPYGAIVAVNSWGVDVNTLNILATLLIFDIITGVVRTGVIDGVRAIKSKTWIVGVINKGLIFMLPPLFGYVRTWLGFDPHFMTGSFIMVLCLYEFYSILGNLLSIRKGEHIKAEGDVITWSIEKLMSLTKVILDKLYQETARKPADKEK